MKGLQPPKRRLWFILTLILALLAWVYGCAPATPSPLPSPIAEALILSTSPSPTQEAATATRPLPSPSPTPCAQTTGQVEVHEIDPTPIGKPLRFRIYLPPCYAARPAAGYPVLYLLHGQSSDETLWLSLGLPETLDGLIQSRAIAPFLVVMPYEEYNLKDAGESRYGEALSEVLMPWVEANLPACAGRACRAIGGISRGGAWALRLAVAEPQRFIAVGGHSPVPFWDETMRLRQRAAALSPAEWPHIYLDMGRKDRYLRYASEFVEALEALGLPYEWHLNDGEHDPAYWQAHLQEYLLWYAAQFP